MSSSQLTADQGREIDRVERRDIPAQDGAALLRGQIAGVLGEEVLRPRPRRVAVREVVRPHEVAPVHESRRLERERLARRQPVPVALVGMVHAVHERPSTSPRTR